MSYIARGVRVMKLDGEIVANCFEHPRPEEAARHLADALNAAHDAGYTAGAEAMREAAADEAESHFSPAWVYPENSGPGGGGRQWMGPGEFVRALPLPEPPKESDE